MQRAVEVGSVDRVIPAAELRPRLIDAIERGMGRTLDGIERSGDEGSARGRAGNGASAPQTSIA